MVIEILKEEEKRLKDAETQRRIDAGEMAPVVPKPADNLYMDTITNDAEKSNLFDMMMCKGSPADIDLWERFQKEELVAGESDLMTVHRERFSKMIREIEAVNAMLTPEISKQLSSSNPLFEKNDEECRWTGKKHAHVQERDGGARDKRSCPFRGNTSERR